MNQAIVFIPVRGNSKSIPNKNIRDFNGQPLVYWVTRAAQEAVKVDKVIVATDSDEIKHIVQGFGFEKVRVFDRSKENASDSASTESVMLEYLQSPVAQLKDDDLFILVQATSPFLKPDHLNEAIEQMVAGDVDSLLSGVKVKRFFWDEDGKPINYDFKNRPRRQDFKGQFIENGAFYVNSVQHVLKCHNRLYGRIGVYEMPEYTSLELDEEKDWELGEYIMKRERPGNSTKNLDQIKLLLTDVDGVLTDSGMYYSEGGDELKKFNTRDGKAFELLKKAGIKVGIVTSENTQIVDRRAKKLKADFLFQGVTDKLSVVKTIVDKEGLTMDQVAYVGDDLNDLKVLQEVGFAACPSDAVKEVREIHSIMIVNRRGGEGVVREVAEILITPNKNDVVVN